MQWMTTLGQDQSGSVAGAGGQNAAVEKLSGLLQHLGSSGGALLQQLGQPLQRERSWPEATSQLPGGLWVLGLLGALLAVFGLAAVALHFFRCSCSGPSCKEERKQSLLP